MRRDPPNRRRALRACPDRPAVGTCAHARTQRAGARTRRASAAPRRGNVDGEHDLGPSARERRSAELRLYGLNAVRAVFARRPQAIRKLYLGEARIPQLQPLLKWCVGNRVGYRVVDEEDLHKLAASTTTKASSPTCCAKNRWR